jgi:hypothetical protein
MALGTSTLSLSSAMDGYNRQMLRIVEEYEKAGMPTPFTLDAVAYWAITTRRWKAPDKVARSKCAEVLG